MGKSFGRGSCDSLRVGRLRRYRQTSVCVKWWYGVMAFMPASKRQSGIAAIRTNINLIALADIHGDAMAERRHYSHQSEWTILKMAVLV